MFDFAPPIFMIVCSTTGMAHLKFTLYSFPILRKLEFSRQIFENVSKTKLYKLPPVGFKLFHADKEPDRHDVKLIVAFLKFTNAPKNPNATCIYVLTNWRFPVATTWQADYSAGWNRRLGYSRSKSFHAQRHSNHLHSCTQKAHHQYPQWLLKIRTCKSDLNRQCLDNDGFFFLPTWCTNSLIHFLHSSTCFEHYCAHLQEDNCINTASGIVTLFGWLFSTQVTRVTVSDAVLIQLSSWIWA